MCAENLCVAGLRGFSYAPEGPLTASQRVTTGRPRATGPPHALPAGASLDGLASPREPPIRIYALDLWDRRSTFPHVRTALPKGRLTGCG
jgi:hypothetical protein